MSDYVSIGGLIYPTGFGDYDAWKLASHYDGWRDDEGPDFECQQCMDVGWMAGDEQPEPCPYCSLEIEQDERGFSTQVLL